MIMFDWKRSSRWRSGAWVLKLLLDPALYAKDGAIFHDAWVTFDIIPQNSSLSNNQVDLVHKRSCTWTTTSAVRMRSGSQPQPTTACTRTGT